MRTSQIDGSDAENKRSLSLCTVPCDQVDSDAIMRGGDQFYLALKALNWFES